jgi:hypothetical protein
VARTGIGATVSDREKTPIFGDLPETLPPGIPAVQVASAVIRRGFDLLLNAERGGEP